MSETTPQSDLSKLTDFEITMLVIERDTAQFKAGRIDELLNKCGRAKGFVDAEKKEFLWDASKIEWIKTEGAKGIYERYPEQGKKPEVTNDYRNILADLKAHQGKMRRKGYFYWIFTDQATVGRKLMGPIPK